MSIDGPKELHDYNRVFSGNIGTFDLVDKNIEILKSKGINILAIQATLTKEFYYQYSKSDIADFLFEKYKVPFIKVEYNIKDQIQDNCEKEVADYITRIMEEKYILDCDTNHFFKRMFSKSYSDYFCESGNAVISISTQGKIFPCQIFLNKEDYCLGNVQVYKKNMFLKDINIPKKSLSEKCNSCIAKCYCSTCGENRRNDDECDILKEKTVKILNLLFQLLKEEKMMDVLNKYQKMMYRVDSN